MWKCEKCKKKFGNDTMAVDVRFGYVAEEEAKESKSQDIIFYTAQGFGPLCDERIF